MTTSNNVEELDVWKDAIELAKEIYTLTQKEVFQTDPMIINQIRQLSIQIPTHISTGFNLNDRNGFIEHLHQSQTSCKELESLFAVTYELGHINVNEKIKFHSLVNRLNEKIALLLRYLNNKKLIKADY